MKTTVALLGVLAVGAGLATTYSVMSSHAKTQAAQAAAAAAAVGAQPGPTTSRSGTMPVPTGQYSNGSPLHGDEPANAAPIFRGATGEMADEYYRKTGRNIYQDSPPTVYTTFP